MSATLLNEHGMVWYRMPDEFLERPKKKNKKRPVIGPAKEVANEL